MLHEGRIRQVGTVAEIQATDDPVVRQFIEGRPATGPAGGDETHATSSRSGSRCWRRSRWWSSGRSG